MAWTNYNIKDYTIQDIAIVLKEVWKNDPETHSKLAKINDLAEKLYDANRHKNPFRLAIPGNIGDALWDDEFAKEIGDKFASPEYKDLFEGENGAAALMVIDSRLKHRFKHQDIQVILNGLVKTAKQKYPSVKAVIVQAAMDKDVISANDISITAPSASEEASSTAEKPSLKAEADKRIDILKTSLMKAWAGDTVELRAKQSVVDDFIKDLKKKNELTTPLIDEDIAATLKSTSIGLRADGSTINNPEFSTLFQGNGAGVIEELRTNPTFTAGSSLLQNLDGLILRQKESLGLLRKPVTAAPAVANAANGGAITPAVAAQLAAAGLGAGAAGAAASQTPPLRDFDTATPATSTNTTSTTGTTMTTTPNAPAAEQGGFFGSIIKWLTDKSGGMQSALGIDPSTSGTWGHLLPVTVLFMGGIASKGVIDALKALSSGELGKTGDALGGVVSTGLTCCLLMLAGSAIMGNGVGHQASRATGPSIA